MTPVHRDLGGPVVSCSLEEELRQLRERASASSRTARTLLKEGPLRVILVGLQAGGSTSTHHADGPVTIQVLEGAVELHAEGRDWPLTTGGIVGLAPGVVHDVRSREGGVFLLTIAEPAAIGEQERATSAAMPSGTHPPPIPVFRDLSGAECRELIERHHVGRIAFSFRDRVDIRPIHYVHDDGWLYGRTSEGEKLLTLERNRWMAFEVDEVRGPFDWRSVVVQGTFYRLDGESADPDVAAHAVTLLRSVAPSTMSLHDPTPDRTVLFRIELRDVTGREARTHDW